jgi:hypothetical protein
MNGTDHHIEIVTKPFSGYNEFKLPLTAHLTRERASSADKVELLEAL